MNIETICGLFSIVTALISIIGVAVKINRAIVLLESAVERLGESENNQKIKNINFERRLNSVEKRLIYLERRNYSE